MVDRNGQCRAVLATDTAAPVAALVKELIIHNAEPEADALNRLALRDLRYASITAADPHVGIVIDGSGTTHLHCGKDAVLAEIMQRLNQKWQPPFWYFELPRYRPVRFSLCKKVCEDQGYSRSCRDWRNPASNGKSAFASRSSVLNAPKRQIDEHENAKRQRVGKAD